MVPEFTDEDLAFLRHVRFGELPERVKPEEYVELTETDPPRELSAQQAMVQIQYPGQPPPVG
jgi:hypothetical protein